MLEPRCALPSGHGWPSSPDPTIIAVPCVAVGTKYVDNIDMLEGPQGARPIVRPATAAMAHDDAGHYQSFQEGLESVSILVRRPSPLRTKVPVIKCFC